MAKLTKEEIWSLRLRDARPQIAAALTAQTYTPQTLDALLEKHRADWHFPRRLHLGVFVDYLVKAKLLRVVELARRESANAWGSSEKKTLYIRPTASSFDVALSLRPSSFLSHLSAAHIHGLTDLLPMTVYANQEQSPKAAVKKPTALQQSAVDQAFSKPSRRTSLVYEGDGYQFVLLAGAHTGRLEVLRCSAPDGRSYEATSVERTLIECAVRPAYAGGIHEVQSMYEAAHDKISLRRLRKVLDDMGFIYPYRQAIGFLLERSGYPAKRVQAFAEPPFENDFYLDYAMQDPEFSSRWRIYHPRGF